jgi:hypothetical protein
MQAPNFCHIRQVMMNKRKPDSVTEREARQAAKLRDNLRRRKDQSRQRQAPSSEKSEQSDKDKRP